MGSEVLTKIWKLKRIVSQLGTQYTCFTGTKEHILTQKALLVEDIEGCERAIQDVQEDEEALALICMSAMHENPRDYMLLLQNGVGNTGSQSTQFTCVDWYKCTHTDAAAVKPRATICGVCLRLLVQTYTY